MKNTKKGKIDKRTKEYKQSLIEDKNYKNVIDLSMNESEGLGDTIHKTLNNPIMKPLTDMVKKWMFKDPENCGCEERQKALNKLFPYKRKVEWLKEEDYLWVGNFMETRKPNKLNDTEMVRIATIHSYVFNHKYLKPCGCSPKIWNEWISDIIKVYEEIKKEQEL